MEHLKNFTKELNAGDLTDIRFSINSAGGGGNVRELDNPDGQGNIKGLVQELGERKIPFFTVSDLPDTATICGVARLGSPGAKADLYADAAAQAVVTGIEKLCEAQNMDFPTAVFPVEATAGQMARATRAANESSKALGITVGILDGDVCGGLAVPSVPLAFGIDKALKHYPKMSIIELVRANTIRPKVTILEAINSYMLEEELRNTAANSEFGAIWFAWFLTKASDFKDFFTTGSVSNAIKRGSLIRQQKLYSEHEAEELLTGTVTEAKDEEAPGFKQRSFTLQTSVGNVGIAARNEYIVAYDEKGEVMARAPKILNLVGPEGPIQIHMLTLGERVSLVTATPMCLINHPDKEIEWQDIWDKYWSAQKQNGSWPHPY